MNARVVLQRGLADACHFDVVLQTLLGALLIFISVAIIYSPFRSPVRRKQRERESEMEQDGTVDGRKKDETCAFVIIFSPMRSPYKELKRNLFQIHRRLGGEKLLCARIVSVRKRYVGGLKVVIAYGMG